MSVFTLAISCLTSSIYLDWFQLPMQYCSLQQLTLLSPPETSTIEHHFCFGSASSFFLELPVHSFPVADQTPTDLRGSFSSKISFCLFILFTGFSRQEYWSGLPFPSPVDHILSHITTWTSPDGQYQNQINYILCSQKWSSIQWAKTRPGPDYDSDHELHVAKFRLKLKKVGKTTRPFRYDLNQIPWTYSSWQLDSRV